MVADRRLRMLALVLAVVGTGVTAYLTYIHYAGISPVCNVTHGCEKVLGSKYAELLGVPLSLWGLVGYVLIVVALIADGEWGKIAAAFFALIGFGQSLYLLYREVFTIEAFCQWCLVSLVVMTVLLVVVLWRLLRDPALPDKSASTP